MPARQLTARFVETVKTDKYREEYRDLAVEGFELRVMANGTKSWVLRYRRQSDAKKRVLTIGRYPDFSLLEARDAAEDARRIVARGGDPARDKLGRKAADTFAELAEQWLTQHCEINKRPASVRNDRSILRLHVLPQIGPMKAAEVTRRDISQLLATNVRSPDRRFAGKTVRKTRARKLDSARRTVRNPNHVYAVVRATYRWALAQGLVEADPTWGMRPPIVEVKPRERVLSPDEIRRFWSNLDNAPIPEMFRILFRLALVTAQRIGEVGGIDMAHLDVDAAAPVWTIPGTVTKNHEPHKVWLSVMAVELIKQARALAPDSRWLFPLPSKDKAISTPNAVDMMKAARASLAIADFRLHDLRRTAATFMGELGIADRDIEGILNHISGQRGVTRRHYDRAKREAAKREAMRRWSEQLAEILRENKQMPVLGCIGNGLVLPQADTTRSATAESSASSYESFAGSSPIVE